MANLNYNKVIIGGRLTSKPELKTTPSGLSVTTFTVAVNRRAKQGEQPQADFFNVTAWRQTAETVTKYFDKGSSILVTGSLQNRSYNDKDGVKHNLTEILADEITFVDSRSDGSLRISQPTVAPTPQQGTIEAPSLDELGGEEELPF